jgi:pimeloyl-ACP methyl ester carboxylesterase
MGPTAQVQPRRMATAAAAVLLLTWTGSIATPDAVAKPVPRLGNGGAERAVIGTPMHLVRPTPHRGLRWGPCPFPDSPATLDCATIAVPLDYARPNGAKTSITVDRLKATGHPSRTRSLVFDPGGPGGSGTGIVYFESVGAHLFSAGVRRHFDLIGLDPRGIGLSNQLRCNPALLNDHVSLFPETRVGFRRLVAHNHALGRSCRRLSGPLFGHMDTVSAARDMEAVREALGQGGLNYLGLSYGSQLGTTYAELYPARIRRMALDGALVHSLPPITLFEDEESSYASSLHRFFRWCDRAPRCALHGRNVARLFDRLVAVADRAPIPAPECGANACRRRVSGEDIRFEAQGLLAFKRPIPLAAPGGWNDLAIALRQAAAGDASRLSAPRASSPADDALNGGALAIECLDWPTPVHNYRDFKRLQLLGRTTSPRLGGASQSWTIIAGCIGWPAQVVDPPHPVTVAGTRPILIVNATHDVETPYVWAEQLASDVRSSVLLTRAGDGHTSYLADGRSRTRDAIDRYLVSGKTPPPNTVYSN